MNKILMAIPTQGQMEAATALVVAEIAARPDVTLSCGVGSPVDQVRNGLVRTFLENTEFTHLFMMDSDIVPPTKVLDYLLECDAPMATGIVPIMMHGVVIANILMADAEGELGFVVDWSNHTEPWEVANAGTGCVLIRRDVLEAVQEPWFRHVEGIDGTERVGEDIYFGRQASKLGFHYTAHPKAVCDHFKKMRLLDVAKGINRENMTAESEINK